jgi:hypothetical protein
MDGLAAVSKGHYHNYTRASKEIRLAVVSLGCSELLARLDGRFEWFREVSGHVHHARGEPRA